MTDQQGITPRRSHRNASVFLPFTLHCILLLGILFAAVVELMPPTILAQRQEIPHRHSTAKNIIVAEKLVAKRLPIPPSHWAYSRCIELGNGVWYAQGIVDIVSPSGERARLGWMTFFLPETPQSLYLFVGQREEGDYYAALRRAGITEY